MRVFNIAIPLSLLYCALVVASGHSSDEDEDSVNLPQLRFLSQYHAPQDDRTQPVGGVYWTPDGKKVHDAKTLEIIRDVQGYPQKRPALFLFFTHLEFRRTYARVTITDADGKIVDPKMSRRTSQLSDLGKPSGAIGLRVYIPEDIEIPGNGTVRLSYTIGKWMRVSEVGPDQRPRVDKGVKVLAIGQDANKRAFVSLWIDADTKQQFQYRPRAVLTDSTTLESSSRSESYEPIDVTTFGYRVPLEDIQSFSIYRRLVKVIEIDNVSFLPGHVTKPTYRVVDSNTSELP